MRFEQLHERGLFCVKNVCFSAFFVTPNVLLLFLLSQVLMVGGSFALKQFASLRYDFQRSKKVQLQKSPQIILDDYSLHPLNFN